MLLFAQTQCASAWDVGNAVPRPRCLVILFPAGQLADLNEQHVEIVAYIETNSLSSYAFNSSSIST